MELTNEQLEQVRDMAAALLPPNEIALLLGLKAEEREYFDSMCRNSTDNPVYLAYNQGRLQTKLDLRRTVVKLAKSGSPAAQPLVDGYIRSQGMSK